MLRKQIKVTTESIEDMFSSTSRLWMERMNESDDRINVLEARMNKYEDKIQVLEARIAELESNDKIQVLEALIASLQSTTIGGSSFRE